MVPPGETVHTTRARRRRWLIAAAAALGLAALLVYVFVFSRHGYLRRRQLERENAQLQSELARLRTENAELRREISSMDDPAVVEKLAREQLGLVKDGDTVYRFVTPPTAAKPEPQPPPK
jgi:cell division protein FtsB